MNCKKHMQITDFGISEKHKNFSKQHVFFNLLKAE